MEANRRLIHLELKLLAILRERTPHNAQVAQLELLSSLKTEQNNRNGFLLDENLVNAAYAFWEMGCLDLAETAMSRVKATDRFQIDFSVLGFRCGADYAGCPSERVFVIASSFAEVADKSFMERQQACINAAQRVAAKEGNILLVNAGFKANLRCLDDWLYAELNRSAVDLLPGLKRALPVVKDVFDATAGVAQDHGAEFFIVLNNDILLTDEVLHLIRVLLDRGYINIGVVRTDVETFDNVSPKKWLGVHLSGIDLFVCNTEWWSCHRHLFGDYLLGVPYWDCVFSGIMMAHSRYYYASQHRGAVFHVRHQALNYSDGRSLQERHNKGLRDENDFIYFQMHERYCDLIRAYLRKNHSLPCHGRNEEMLENKFIRELRKRLG